MNPALPNSYPFYQNIVEPDVIYHQQLVGIKKKGSAG